VAGIFARRRNERPRPRALTASAATIDLRDPAAARRLSRGRSRWQEDAWTYRDEVGELRYALQFLANVCRRMRLYPAIGAPDGVDPTPIDKAEGVSSALAAAALDQVARLAIGRAHAGEILAVGAECLEVVGEAMLVGVVLPDGGEQWQLHSVDEVRYSDGTWTVRTDPAGGDLHRLDPELDYVARVWRPHPRWSGMPDSPVRALLDTLEEILVDGRALRASTRSRIPAGLLLLSDEVTLAGNSDDPGETEEDAEDRLLRELGGALATAVSDEGSPAALVPFLMRVPGNPAEAMVHLPLSRDADPKLLDRLEAALRRLGMGLDVPPEIVTGMADVNHWTAWQIDDSTFRHHVEPLVQVLVDALTVAFIRPALLALGFAHDEVDRVVLWYDPAAVVSRPNRGTDADAAHDRLAISDESYRRSRGFDEDDAPTDDELVRRTGLQRGVIADPVLRAILEVLLGQARVIDAVPAIPAGTSSGDPADEPEQDDAGGDEDDPGPPAGANTTTGAPALTAAGDDPDERRRRRQSLRLATVDRDLRNRVHAAADAAVARALERAGNRIRAAAQQDPSLRASVNGQPPHLVASIIGPDAVTAAGLDVEQLLEAAFEVLSGQWDAWVSAAQEEALDLAADLARLDRDSDAVRARIGRARDVHADAAVSGWRWLHEQLRRLVQRLLFEPLAGHDNEPGEASDARVPVGLIRGALAIASGARPPLNDDGTHSRRGEPLPTIGGAGPVGDLIRAAGHDVDGYEWVYGVSSRPFHPHRELDGQQFTSWADEVLTVRPADASWLGPVYVPGDHPGCHCDYALLWGGSSSEDQVRAIGDETYDPTQLQLLTSLALADIDAGRLDTTAVQAVVEAERAANTRPTGTPTGTPVTDALRAARARARGLAAAGAT
jgi:hypothetical protein